VSELADPVSEPAVGLHQDALGQKPADELVRVYEVELTHGARKVALDGNGAAALRTLDRNFSLVAQATSERRSRGAGDIQPHRRSRAAVAIARSAGSRSPTSAGANSAASDRGAIASSPIASSALACSPATAATLSNPRGGRGESCFRALADQVALELRERTEDIGR
jgi:hypothetical protein